MRKILRILPDKLYISLLYYKHFKRFPNLKNPETFNEKLQWLKLHDRKPEYTTMVDKHLVKQYIAEKLGDEYVIPTLGAWNSPEEIDFDSLPEQFVLKWNHDSGSIIICKDKSAFDKEGAVKRLLPGKKKSGFWYSREWPYKNVRPKIIAEKYLCEESGDDLIDYKFYCFNGKAQYLYVSAGLHDHSTASISFLTMDWEFAPFGRSDFKSFDALPQKPSRFDEMKIIAEKLAEGHDFLRVDLYQVKGQIYFSELTFSPCAGLMPFYPKEWDKKLGDILELKK